MNHSYRPAVAVAALALSASPLLLAVPAGADTGPGGASKAAIEHAERQATGAGGLSKAQIEQRERESAPLVRTTVRRGPFDAPSAPSAPSGDTGAAAWQLALSAAFGAVLTGGVVVASRQVGHHRHAVAS